MPTLESQVLNVGRTGFADRKPVETKQHRERHMGMVVVLGGEQEHAELRAIQATRVRGVHLRTAHVLRRVDAIRPSMCAWTIPEVPIEDAPYRHIRARSCFKGGLAASARMVRHGLRWT